MKDRPDRAARLQLIESMFAGHSWQTAAAQSQLKISRSTAYRLVQLARNEEKAGVIFHIYLALAQAQTSSTLFSFHIYLANYSTHIRVDRTYYHKYLG